ncbi:PBP1 (YGR178C) [Zygosaccharomyces parabailii]|nr:PBP1 (YGR178C) [Zygosaccharomyces parabailii]
MKGNFNNKRRDHSSSNGNTVGGIGNATSSGRSGGPSGSGSSTFYENAEISKGFSDRLDYLMANSIGCEAVATVTSGAKYSGLLAASNLESTNGIDIVLRFPKVVDTVFTDNTDKLQDQLEETLLIHGEDVAELELNNIDFSLDEKSENTKRQENDAKQKREKIVQEENGKKGFKTDTDISSGSKPELKERELLKWTPDEGDENLGETLEDSAGAWDQFTVNEEKFGVKSSFDEHFYTTKINKGAPNYEQRVKEAEKIAKEIESQGTSSNYHLNEERGIVIDDSGADEEDLYSGVDRRGNELLAALKTNAKPVVQQDSKKYVAPTLRDQPHHTDPAIISSTTAKGPRPSSGQVGGNGPPKTKQQTQAANKSSSTADAAKHEHAPSAVSGKSPKKEYSNNSKKHITAKEAQIEELKKFSQKFKVPYDVPEDMKDILKKSALKGDPSLPPKPQSSSNRPSVPATPSSGKIDIKKSTKGSSQEQLPLDSPSSRISSSRKRYATSFFGSKVLPPDNSRKEAFSKDFNMFLRSKEAYDEKKREKASESKVMEPFFIEKPYFTAPTWPSTVEQSYKSFFPDERTAVQRAQMSLQQRQMNSMSAAAAVANQQMGVVMGNMMRFPMGPGGSSTPMMNGMGGNMGMYMPFQPQPMFYPSMPQMMSMMGGDDGSGSHSPQAVSPHIPPAYMNGAPGTPMAFGYPGAMPFQTSMLGQGGPRVGGGGNYRQNYHHHHNNHGNHNHYKSNHESRN